MSSKKSPYEALGIDTKATKEQIQKAYNDLVQKVSEIGRRRIMGLYLIQFESPDTHSARLQEVDARYQYLPLLLQVGSLADDASNEALEAYGDAYKVLSDDSERAAYDKQKISTQVGHV